MATPFESVPGPRDPMPTTTQQTKKTNVQIPVARMSLKPIPEGSIVFIERQPHYHAELGRAQQTPHHVVDLRSLNTYLASTTDKKMTEDVLNCMSKTNAAARGTADNSFPWTLDGVVNNSEMLAKPELESSAVITNVAVQGPCRLINNDEQQRCERKKSHPGSVIYVARWKRIYVPYALQPGTDKYRAWQIYLKDASSGQSITNPTIAAAVAELRCTDYVSAFSSTQLSSGEYKLNESDRTKFPYANFEDSKGAFGSLVEKVLLQNLVLWAPELKIDTLKPYLGTGERAGMWGFDVMVDLWKLGSTMDSNQAGPGMRGGVLTVNVAIEHLPMFRATDVDAMDVDSLIEGPLHYYHLLRIGIGGQETPLEQFLDKDVAGGSKVRDIRRTQVENKLSTVINGTNDDNLRGLFFALLFSPYARSNVRKQWSGMDFQKIMNIMMGMDANSKAKRKEILELAFETDLQNLCRSACTADEPEYGKLCEDPVGAGWGAAEQAGKIRRVRGRESLQAYLIDRWVLPTGEPEPTGPKAGQPKPREPLRLRKEPQSEDYDPTSTVSEEAAYSV